MATYNTQDEELLLSYISKAHHDEEEPCYMVIPDGLFEWPREKIIAVAKELDNQGLIEFSELYNSACFFGTSNHMTQNANPLRAKIINSDSHQVSKSTKGHK